MPIPTDTDARMLEDRARRLRREGVTTNERTPAAASDEPRADRGDDRDRAAPDADPHLLETVEPSADLVLVNPTTGEALAPTVANAEAVIAIAREAKRRLDRFIAEAAEVVAAVSAERGTKTFDLGDGRKLTLSGGPGTTIDPVALREALAAADCPSDRIDAAIKQVVEEKVDRSVTRSLAGANPDYAAAIELATTPVVKPWSVSIKERPR